MTEDVMRDTDEGVAELDDPALALILATLPNSPFCSPEKANRAIRILKAEESGELGAYIVIEFVKGALLGSIVVWTLLYAFEGWLWQTIVGGGLLMYITLWFATRPIAIREKYSWASDGLRELRASSDPLARGRAMQRILAKAAELEMAAVANEVPLRN